MVLRKGADPESKGVCPGPGVGKTDLASRSPNGCSLSRSCACQMPMKVRSTRTKAPV